MTQLIQYCDKVKKAPNNKLFQSQRDFCATLVAGLFPDPTGGRDKAKQIILSVVRNKDRHCVKWLRILMNPQSKYTSLRKAKVLYDNISFCCIVSWGCLLYVRIVMLLQKELLRILKTQSVSNAALDYVSMLASKLGLTMLNFESVQFIFRAVVTNLKHKRRMLYMAGLTLVHAVSRKFPTLLTHSTASLAQLIKVEDPAVVDVALEVSCKYSDFDFVMYDV